MDKIEEAGGDILHCHDQALPRSAMGMELPPGQSCGEVES
jgi:hypothetical protein